MKRTLTVILLAASIAQTAPVAALGADRYVIDPVHTSVGFAVRHLVISKVRGNFKEFSGTIVYDEQDITRSSVDVTINSASINTENVKRDRHLRSPDFLDAGRFPTLTFTSKRIEERGDGHVAVGDLTIRGVTREVALPFTLNGKIVDPWGKTRIGAEAELTINRHDFGVSWSERMDSGGLVVGNEVKITISVEAIKS
jgi:polyisoprenoid-binding protein YceI